MNQIAVTLAASPIWMFARGILGFSAYVLAMTLIGYPLLMMIAAVTLALPDKTPLGGHTET